MAQVKDGINGPVKGRVGNVVFYTMYGKTIARSLPQINRRKKPTLKQQAQRQKMKLVQELLQPLRHFIKITFAPAAQDNAPYHVAKSYNLLHAIHGEYPNQTINWPKVQLSAGSIELPDDCLVQRVEGGWYFRWSSQKGRASDTLVVIAFVPENNWVEYQLTGVKRAEEEFFWKVDNDGALWHVWIAFRSQDETNISDSRYVGEK